MWIEETEEGVNRQRTGVERFSNRVYHRGARPEFYLTIFFSNKIFQIIFFK